MAVEFINDARKEYGPITTNRKVGSCVQDNAGVRALKIDFDFDSLPVQSEVDSLVKSLPAHSWIKSATLRVKTAFAGGTSYNIGLYQADGTVIDADGIDAAVALTAIDAVGETVVCDGALVGNTAGIGANAGQVVVAATGTFTAGQATLLIEYVPPAV